jgi:hypothetical protein
VSIDQRLSRLAPALTAQERAILILEAWKDGRPEDPSWRKHMPQDQTRSFNHYIELMNQANLILGKVCGVLAMQAEVLEQREAWLVGLTLWQEQIEEIARAVRLAVREPITESEYQVALEAARDEWVPVEELASFLAGERDYSKDDYEEGEEGWGPVVKDEVWDRAVAEEEKRLRALVADGKLPSRGKGKALKLQHRALQHFGRDVGAVPEDYLSYRVVPDDQAEEVEVDRFYLRRLQRVIAWQEPDGPDGDKLTDMPAKIRQGLSETTAYRLVVSWVELRSVEMVLDEIGEEFNGLDPLRPVFREKLDGTKARLLAVKEHLLFLKMDVVLREPLDEEIEEVRGWITQSRPTS